MIWSIIWVVSVVYVIIRLIISNTNKSHDGVTGNTPAFDAIIFICGAPFFALVDLAARWFTLIRNK